MDCGLLVLPFGHAVTEQGVAAEAECRCQQARYGNDTKRSHQTDPVERTPRLTGIALRMLKIISRYARYSGPVRGIDNLAAHRPEARGPQCLVEPPEQSIDRARSL
jgi:hypothetical protein